MRSKNCGKSEAGTLSRHSADLDPTDREVNNGNEREHLEAGNHGGKEKEIGQKEEKAVEVAQ